MGIIKGTGAAVVVTLVVLAILNNVGMLAPVANIVNGTSNPGA